MITSSIFSWLIPPSKTPTPSATATFPPTAQPTLALLAPAPTKPAIVVSSNAFGGKSQVGTIPAPPQNNPSTLRPVAGQALPLVSAAVAAMAAAAAYALQRKREEDEAAKEEQDAKMRAKARTRAEAEWDRASAKKNVQPHGRKLDDVTEAERLAAYKQTDRYKNYQTSMQAWEQKNKNEAKAAQADMTQAEELAAYQQTDRYKSYQAKLQAWEQQKANEDFREGEREPIMVKGPVLLNWSPSLPPTNHYHQSQMDVGPKTGPVECVTTASVAAMNMMKDLLAEKFGLASIPDKHVKDYVSELDAMKLLELPYRVPSDFPNVPIINMPIAGWMHPVLQEQNALNKFSGELRHQYGCGFTVQQTSGNNLDDIAKNLQDGNLVIVHGLWQVTDPHNAQYYLGGAPHTMGPILGIDGHAKTITILDTGDSTSPTTMSFQDFQAWWGRPSLGNLYTKPNTMTVLF